MNIKLHKLLFNKLVLCNYLFAVTPLPVHAEAITDGSVGKVQSLSGQMTIPQSLGTTAGNNLFHSFKTFNINTGESATFTGSDSLKNVISRVTGGNSSNIDGLLKSTIGKADFYFINPAGVTFGANAKVDVPAAFHVSTADALQFADGSQFSATNPTASTLNIAEPASFGFVGHANSQVEIHGAKLATNTVGQDFDIVAGRIVIANNADIKAEAGAIRLNAVGKDKTTVSITGVAEVTKGSIAVDSSTLDVSGNGSGKLEIQGGEVSVTGNSQLLAHNTGAQDASAEQGIAIEANNLTVENSRIQANAGGVGQGADVSVTVGDKLSVVNGGQISSGMGDIGNAGDIKVDAGKILVNGQGNDQFTGILSKPDNETIVNTGDAGLVSIKGDSLSVLNGGMIYSDTWSTGDAGDVEIDVGKILVDGQGNYAWITSDTNNETIANAGNAGTVNIKGDSLTVLNGGTIASSTWGTGNAGSVKIKGDNLNLLNNGLIISVTNGTGNAGNVEIDVDEILVDGQGNDATISGDTNNETLANAGHAGIVNIKGNRLSVLNGGTIASSTRGTGNAGNVEINVDDILVDGQGNSALIISTSNNEILANAGSSGTVNIKAYSLSVLNEAEIYTGVWSTGNAGNVEIDVDEILVDGQGNNAWISSDTNNETLANAGNAGIVNIKVNRLSVLNGGIIESSGGTGNAGSVKIKGDNLNLLNNGWISSGTDGSGNAGNVEIDVGEILVDGQGNNVWITSFTNNQTLANSGNAGTVSIKGDSLSLLNGGIIESSTWGAGNAGDVEIDVSNILVDGQGNSTLIRSVTNNETLANAGNSGAVSIKGDSLSLLNGGIIADVTYGSGNAGTVEVCAEILSVLGEGGIEGTTYGAGNAGNINIDANNIMVTGPNIYCISCFAGGIKSLSFDDDAGYSNASMGGAGNISINAKSLSVLDGGVISSWTKGTGKGGDIKITSGELIVKGQRSQDGFPSIIDVGTYGHGYSSGGVLDVITNKIDISNGGSLSSVTWCQGDAGKINVSTKSFIMNNGSINAGSYDDGDGGGEGGDIIIFAKNINIGQGGIITTTTSSTGRSGNIALKSNNLSINNAYVTTETNGSGNAGDLRVSSSLITLDNAEIVATAKQGSNGAAGSVTVNVSKVLSATNSASINSSTFGNGKAGAVTVDSPNISLDNNAEISALAGANSGGQTGEVKVNANNINLSNGGKISIQNEGIANNPTQIKLSELTLNSNSLAMNGGIITAATRGNVNAGNVAVTTQNPLTMTAKASINSSTSGSGSAGNVSVIAPVVSIDNAAISAEATANSSGQTGGVKVTATKALFVTNQGKITIQNDATVANPAPIKAGVIIVSAPDINLKNSSITAESTGNIDAGSIVTHFSHQLNMDPSFITTSANLGNGGNITINGGGLINLQDSGFLTSVTGADGNGGNINVAAGLLVMNTGVIQANALGGKGGDIGLNLKALIPSQDSLIKGGTQVKWQPYLLGFNVIQAASATGVSGNINLTSPQLNISGVISGLDSSGLVLPVIDRNPCQGAALDSTLARKGKGGLPITEAKYVFVSPIADLKPLTDLSLPAKSEITPFSQKEENQPCTTAFTSLK